jgi:LuxR family maltose regulon positive regulatory protein
MHATPTTPTDSQRSTGERMHLVTKLTIPPLCPDLVARPRLTIQLYRSIQCPLTLIAAPAGFGKTTLLSAWLADGPCAAA